MSCCCDPVTDWILGATMVNGGTTSPNLQQVTDAGNTTTNDITMTEATLSITDGGSDLLQFQAAGGTTYLKFDTQHRLVKPAQGAALQNDSMTFLSEIDSSGSGVQGAFEFQFTSATIERFIQFRDNGNAIVAELEVGGQLWFGESASGGSRYIYESYNGPTWTGVHTFDNDVTFNSGNNVSLDGSNAFNGTATFFANTFHRDDIRLHLGSSLDSYLTWDSVGSTLDCFVYDGVSAYNEIWNASLSAFNVVASATFAGGISGAVTFSGGNVEFDSTTQFDGAATFNSTATFNGSATFSVSPITLNDSVELELGTDGDASLYFDGTDAIWDRDSYGGGAGTEAFKILWDEQKAQNSINADAAVMRWYYTNATPTEVELAGIYPSFTGNAVNRGTSILAISHGTVGYMGFIPSSGSATFTGLGRVGSVMELFLDGSVKMATTNLGMSVERELSNTTTNQPFDFKSTTGIAGVRRAFRFYAQDNIGTAARHIAQFGHNSGNTLVFSVWPEGSGDLDGIGVKADGIVGFNDSGSELQTRSTVYMQYVDADSSLELTAPHFNIKAASNVAPGALFYSGW